MTYYLKEMTFTKDFCFIELNNGITIALNMLDEQISVDGAEADINQINIAVITNEGEQIKASGVIGMSNEYFSLNTEYKEYLGYILNKDNIKYCTLEVADD